MEGGYICEQVASWADKYTTFQGLFGAKEFHRNFGEFYSFFTFFYIDSLVCRIRNYMNDYDGLFCMQLQMKLSTLPELMEIFLSFSENYAMHLI